MKIFATINNDVKQTCCLNLACFSKSMFVTIDEGDSGIGVRVMET